MAWAALYQTRWLCQATNIGEYGSACQGNEGYRLEDELVGVRRRQLLELDVLDVGARSDSLSEF